ncbi:MAG: hypothetical protein AMXMBFR20_22430 [Planctomycetia bacterium]|jgi:hypothetical protein|nr:MAG: hypothetical protein B6D36_07050 [Planctomycetes bacterium UTPLA1]
MQNAEAAGRFIESRGADQVRSEASGRPAIFIAPLLNLMVAIASQGPKTRLASGGVFALVRSLQLRLGCVLSSKIGLQL